MFSLEQETRGDCPYFQLESFDFNLDLTNANSFILLFTVFLFSPIWTEQIETTEIFGRFMELVSIVMPNFWSLIEIFKIHGQRNI